ncbi:MAG TPA: polysaccharide deacetylase family protein [Solirubrobacterales bacterium]|nr:polysaccharide deacetylase family protein [Solirubrobacterales bacterium]
MTTARTLILCYHRVSDAPTDPWSLAVTPKNFADQLELLRERCTPTPLRDLSRTLGDAPATRRGVVVTFDDGYADNLHNAKPLLERYEIPATVFVPTGYVGQASELWWDELDRIFLQAGRLPAKLRLKVDGEAREWNLDGAAHYPEEAFRQHHAWRAWEEPPAPRQALYLDLYGLLRGRAAGERQRLLEQIVAWAGGSAAARPTHRVLTRQEAAGLEYGELIQLGAHSVYHPVLSALPVTSQRREIEDSKAWLEDLLEHPVTTFSYPFGQPSDYTAETIALIRKAGFECACALGEGLVGPTTDPFRLPRVQVPDWPRDEFEKRLTEWLAD